MILAALWFSDPEIAQYARDVFGMPAQAAEITYEATAAASGQVAHATWKLPDGQLSEASFYDEQQFDSTYYPNWRIFWGVGSGVSYFDISEVYHTPQASPGVAYGVLAPPMLYGTSMPDPTFATAGQTDIIHEGVASAEISRFSDAECAKPL